jgi:SAM-dependent methyltransferase
MRGIWRARREGCWWKPLCNAPPVAVGFVPSSTQCFKEETVWIFDRFSAGPLDLAKRILQKTLIGPIKYRTPSGYDVEHYWRDCFPKYGTSLRGPGDEGLSEEENRKRYQLAAEALLEAERDAGVDLSTASVMEIGCGAGFYAQLHADLGVESYTGVDVTDVLFEGLKKRVPQYQFVQMDATRATLEGDFDLVLMIDVAHHIVTDEAMDAAMNNVRRVLVPGGIFLVGPFTTREKRHLFYVRFWSTEDIRSRILDLDQFMSVPFRGDQLVGFRRHELST